MGDPNQKIIVVQRHVLFDYGRDYFHGFMSHDEVDYESRILENFLTMRRGGTSEPKDHPEGNAEMDVSHKQPIGYMLVVNPKEKTVFAYQRAGKDKHYSEKRLQGKWSWGAGGHVEPHDGKENPLRKSQLREFGEELELHGKILGSKVLGYINDDKDEVGKVHFGILYLIEIDGKVKLKDEEARRGEMLNLNQLEEICDSSDCVVESWSRIALEPLKKYLSGI